MIIDKIENLKYYFSVNENLKAIAEFVENNNMAELACGSYEINDNVRVGLSEYEPGKTNDPEAHRDYWDLQYAVIGQESIEVFPIDKCSESSGYKPDIEFFAKQNCIPTTVALQAGVFVILEPQDAHRPCARLGDCSHIKKAVFKIKVK